jgi:hypothetical protein
MDVSENAMKQLNAEIPKLYNRNLDVAEVTERIRSIGELPPLIKGDHYILVRQQRS